MRKSFTRQQQFVERANAAARDEWSVAKAREFFVEAYEKIFSAIPAAGELAAVSSSSRTTAQKRAETRFNKAHDRIEEWEAILAEECTQHDLSRSRWTAANAVTNWLDHYKPIVRRKDSLHADEASNRVYNNLLGDTASKKKQVMSLAGIR